MAEAVVDGTPMSRFFCHKCSIEIEVLLPDYTCPRCTSGFIEKLESGSNDSSSGMDISSEESSDHEETTRDVSEFAFYILCLVPNFSLIFFIQLTRIITDRMFGVPDPRPPTGWRRVNWTQTTSDSRRSNSGRGMQDGTLSVQNFIQDLLLNLSGAGVGHPITQDGQPPVFNIRLFLGNPGDYVWSQDGLDTIVTQMLNQLDGTGPPPLPRKQIDEIPTTTVTQSQVESKLQCSVCWEDFKVLESVKQLPCQHVFHAPCIVPWLQLHGTCPICRQSLGDQNSAEANQYTVGPSLAALFRAANESTNTSSSSTSSSENSD
ncbi:E3 ubiquitin-protein ligase Iruka-like isoform X1 [Hylaeus anthracinus]|uniref:E3 ubiquitin-protein ligase Iruka-like isoform X1 n=1 Tax=Hylaeus anthracinus TaxID=313031 RepID=UPI0023B8DD24|nr:E3 ubiquitin-protein ligase Iruka-like isoform X1 [Hylaeus anthracinus]XP_053995613.1 E3 ubiquitin-protein ligase Iruka-like isoform X1 [Hylaeus anthracinus]